MKITITSYFQDEKGEPIVIRKQISRDTNVQEIKELVAKTFDIPLTTITKISAPKEVDDDNLFHSYISSISDNKSLLKPSIFDADSVLETQRVYDGANFFAEIDGWPILISKYLRDQYHMKKYYIVPDCKKVFQILNHIEKQFKLPVSEIILTHLGVQLIENSLLPPKKCILGLVSTEEPYKKPITGTRDLRFWKIVILWLLICIDNLCHLVCAIKLFKFKEDMLAGFILMCLIASIVSRIAYKNFKKAYLTILNFDIFFDEINNCNEGKNTPSASSYFHGLFEVVPCCFMILYSLFKTNSNENSIFQTSAILSILVASKSHTYPLTSFLEDLLKQRVRKANFTSFLSKTKNNYLINQWVLNLLELSCSCILFGLFCLVTFPYGSWAYLLGFYLFAFFAVISFRKLNRPAYSTIEAIFIALGTLLTEGLFSRSFPFIFKGNLRKSYSLALKSSDINDDLVVVIILNFLKTMTKAIFILFVSMLGKTIILQERFLFRYFLASVVFFSIIVMKYAHDIKVLYDFYREIKKRETGKSEKYSNQIENNL